MDVNIGDAEYVTSNKTYIFILGILTVLILFGTHSAIFSLMAFGICTYVITLMNREFALILIIYSMSFAHIFKISADGMSYFTFLMIIYVIVAMIKTAKISVWGVLLSIYIILVQCYVKSIDLKADMKLIGNMFFMFYAFEESENFSEKKLFLGYILGVIIAAALRFLESPFFNISAYEAMKIENFGDNAVIKSMERFSGIYSDPNYFGVNLILAMALLLILYDQKEISLRMMTILSSPLLYYAVLTKSKSVLFMMVLPVSMFIYVNHRKQKYVTQVVFLVIGVILVSLVISGQVHFLDGVLQRLNSSTLDNPSGLTTGRTDRWLEYFRLFYQNPSSFLWGVGIGNLGDDIIVHNFYLESLRYAGLFGSLIIFCLFREVYFLRYSATKKNILNYSAIFCILFMYIFLNQLGDYEFPIHFCLAFMAMVSNLGNRNTVTTAEL